MGHGTDHILVVEDDPTIRESLQRMLLGLGYRVSALEDDRGLEQLVTADPPDLAVLDRSLPHGDGLEIAEWLHKTRDTPIVMITAAGEPGDRISGHAVGADHYLVKPFDLLELQLAVTALLRRTSDKRRRRLVIDDLVIDLAAHRVTVSGTELRLPPRQYDVLAVLAGEPGRAVSKRQLLEDVWGPGYSDPNLVEAQVAALRRHLNRPGRQLLSTVRGAGYRLEAG